MYNYKRKQSSYEHKFMDDIRQNYKATGDTPIAEIAELFPEVAEYLTMEYGFHCIGCPLSYFETLGDGIQVHGLSEDEGKILLEKVNKMIKDLNSEDVYQ